MIIDEKESFPVQYDDILVFPEYFIDYHNKNFYKKIRSYRTPDINYYVIGVGNTYDHKHTSVVLLNKEFKIIGVRNKISIFLDENSTQSLKLQAFPISKNRNLGIVICKEVLHTAIAEVYRMMNVNILAVTIGGGEFWGLQRHSWIDQIKLFSDICKSPLICSCGADKQTGGINLVIK